MAKVYLDSADVFTVSNNNVTVYGSTGSEVVTVSASVNGVTLDQNIEQVVFSGARSSYTYQQAGNQLLVYSGSTLLCRAPLQVDPIPFQSEQFTHAHAGLHRQRDDLAQANRATLICTLEQIIEFTGPQAPIPCLRLGRLAHRAHRVPSGERNR